MKRTLFLFLLVVCLVGCTPDPNRPSDITVKDVNGMCWNLRRSIAMEGTYAIAFVKVPCP